MAKRSTSKTRFPAGITYRGPYQYQARVRRQGVTETRTFETLDEAAAWTDQIKHDLKYDRYVNDRDQRETTLGEVLATYLETVTPKKKGARQEAARILTWQKQRMAAMPIMSIEPRHINEWLTTMDGKAPSTINNSLNLLSAIFKYAKGTLSMTGIRENPCQYIPRAKQRPGRDIFLTSDDEDLLLTACRQGPPWLVWMVHIAIETGMRQGEIRSLRWKNIHNTHVHLEDTKNGEQRDVPLTARAASVFGAMTPDGEAPEFVFPAPEVLKEYTVQRAFIRAVNRAVKHGMTVKPTFHDLRHVAATRLDLVHRDTVDLAKTMGHKTLTMTQRYKNKPPEIRAAAMRAMERKLWAGADAA